MTESFLPVVALSVGLIGCAVILAGKFRLPVMLRYYVVSSILLAAMILIRDRLVHGFISSEGLEPAVLTLLVNGLILPAIIRTAAKRTQSPLRSQGYFRPTPNYFIAAVSVAIAFGLTIWAGLWIDQLQGVLLSTAFSLLFIGVAMLITRRDLFSQIVGFLVIEQNARVVGLLSLGDLSFALELGLQGTLIITVFMFSLLLHRVKEEYGVHDTELLRELTE